MEPPREQRGIGEMGQAVDVAIVARGSCDAIKAASDKFPKHIADKPEAVLEDDERDEDYGFCRLLPERQTARTSNVTPAISPTTTASATTSAIRPIGLSPFRNMPPIEPHIGVWSVPSAQTSANR